MTEPSVGQEAAAEIPRPPNAWWRQRELFIVEAIGFIAIVAGVLVALAPWSDFMRGLVGGALLGLGATLVIVVPFSTRDAWEQQRRDYRVWRTAKEGAEPYIALIRARTINAFYLGVDTRMLTASKEAIQGHLEIAKKRCAISGITFSEKEMKLLARSNPTLKVAAQIADLIAQKARQRDPQEWTFFRLGQLVGSIVPHLETSRPIQPVMQQLDRIRQDQFIRLDKRFRDVTDELSRDLAGFDETASGEPRKLMITQVVKLLERLPTHEIDTYGQDPEQFLIMEGEWYWTQDENGNGIPVCFSAGYMLVAQDAWEYLITRESPAHEAQVKRSDDHWGCSVHADATEDAPCFDIQLVFDHTDGGMPVDRARTILVRTPSKTDPAGQTAPSR